MKRRFFAQIYATLVLAILAFMALLLLARVAEVRRLVPEQAMGILGHSVWLVVLLGVVAAAAGYPLARRTTRRLERLRGQIEGLGQGDVWRRVGVEGTDEVAALALALNRAGERIESLIDAQRTLLATVSHELRSPLARLRLGVELLAADPSDAAAREELDRNVRELDELIDELLLASRLEKARRLERSEDVDMRELLTTEATRVGAKVKGPAVRLRGDTRLLRRLVRNLFENARRHGGAAEIEASVEAMSAERIRITVSDRGPGVAEAEREKIFEPFYRAASRGDAEGGIGLFLVREIARHHGGEVSCQPRPEGGSRFVVELAAA